MLNGLNNTEELNNNSQLENQLGINSISSISSKHPYSNADKSLLIDEASISDIAVSLYEKDQDIQKFNNLAMSDPEDLSADEIISGLFNQGVCDPYSDEALKDISNSSKLFEDLGM